MQAYLDLIKIEVFLALWLVRYMEGRWQSKWIKCEVAKKLKEWDRAMMLHELLD